jgi:uncharacterized protein (DUF697 family)
MAKRKTKGSTSGDAHDAAPANDTPSSNFSEDSMTTESVASATDPIIRKWTYAAAGAGLIPIPIADIAAIAAVQLKMVADLSAHYGVPFYRNQGKAAIGALTGTYISRQMSPLVGSALKAVPVVGQFGGALAMGLSAGASTYAVGRVFDTHFASGGTMLDFDASKVKSVFTREYEKGKAIVKPA